MFTGIIEEVGTIAAVEKSSDCGVLRVRAQTVLEDIHIGDSIAVNGVCLTVISYNQSGFVADVMHETFLRSALGRLGPGSRVNLERAMAANGRFGGQPRPHRRPGGRRHQRNQRPRNRAVGCRRNDTGVQRWITLV